MTREACKAYFTRAMYAPREVILLDEETDWIARHSTPKSVREADHRQTQGGHGAVRESHRHD